MEFFDIAVFVLESRLDINIFHENLLYGKKHSEKS